MVKKRKVTLKNAHDKKTSKRKNAQDKKTKNAHDKKNEKTHIIKNKQTYTKNALDQKTNNHEKNAHDIKITLKPNIRKKRT